jgi:hypothetical protein
MFLIVSKSIQFLLSKEEKKCLEEVEFFKEYKSGKRKIHMAVLFPRSLLYYPP